MRVKVAIDLALDRLFDYEVPVELCRDIKVGQLLRVPFGHREVRGFAMEVWGTGNGERGMGNGERGEPNSSTPNYKIKPVLGIADPLPFFSPGMLKLVRWISEYVCAPVETCLKAAVPAAVLKPGAKHREMLFVEPAGARPPTEPLGLTAYQQELLANLRRVGGGWMRQVCREFSTTPATLRALARKGAVSIGERVRRRDPLAGRSVIPTKPLEPNPAQKAALDAIAEEKRPVLLHGVTGSGKTEVYLQAIARELAAGRGAIVLVPEISLTPQTVRRFAGRFGDAVAVLHSALSDGERYDEWHRIRSGEARVAVGPRSAVFAPVKDLGLIVVDEEHDSSYKQEETPRYNARDVAVMRGRLENCKVVLGSATPSLESWRNAKEGKYALAPIGERVCGYSMPDVRLVDMESEAAERASAPVFSKALLDAMADRLDRGEQTMLLLNRRGYSRSLECGACGAAVACGECSMPYTYHLADDCLRCHVCGGWEKVPETCPSCGAHEFLRSGIGTQRVEQVLKKCFPRAKILRMDADSTSRKNSHDDILAKFRAREGDILIGTQMIAKGLDFPNVTLVGVLNADSSLNMPDFRAAERTFQLVAQVSGRAGRAGKPGEVFVQTFQPENPVIAAAAAADFPAFADAELAERKAAGFPPFARFATALFRAKEQNDALKWAECYSRSLAKYPGLSVSQAMPPTLERANGLFRYQVQIRSGSAKNIANAWRWIIGERPVPKKILATIDIDALSVM